MCHSVMLPNHILHHFSGFSYSVVCLPGNQSTKQHMLAQKHLGGNDDSNVTYIRGVLGPSTCGDHNVLGSQDHLCERGGKCEVTDFVHILQKTRKCQMKASALHSTLH